MVKRFLLGALLAFLGSQAFAGDIVVSSFGGGLDTLDSPAELDASMAQDLLNVQLQPGGGAVFKRDGYGLFQSLPVACSTCAVHGGHHFQQVSGNDVQLWGNDGGLSASVNDAAFVQVATGTVGATWQCADSQGFAYCLNSFRDMAIKTDGSTANTSFQNGIPLGTMATFSPTQLIVAGVTGNENTIYVSQQNTFTTFTIGVLPSSAFIEPIASPGSRITHLAFYFGKLFWWKDQSFGYATFTNQNDWQLTIVSNQIGTLDNSDAFWNSSGFDSGAKFTGTASANAGQSPGGIFFRGQDNHFYVYDGYYLTRISRPITPTVSAANRQKANAWTQTTQADFQAGAIAGKLSTTINPGDVIVSSFGATDLSPGTSTFTDTFASMANWTKLGAYTNPTPSGNQAVCSTAECRTYSNKSVSPNFIVQATVGRDVAACGVNCGNTVAALNASNQGYFAWATDIPNSTIRVCRTADFSTGALLATCAATVCSASNSTAGPVALTLTRNHANNTLTVYANGTSVCSGVDSTYTSFSRVALGIFFNTSYQSSAFYSTPRMVASPVYDTGFPASAMQIQANWTAGASTPTISLRTATAAAGPFTTLLTSTGTNAVGNRYVTYSSTITPTTSGSALPTLQSISVVSRATGTYYSAVNNAPNLTSWSTFSSNDSSTLSSSITYFTRASTNAFTVLSATPAWVAQTKNSNVTASTATYMQMRGDFYVTVATEALALSDFQFNWFEGSASDKAYMTYFNDAIWFSVSASSNSSTNNRVFYWDLLNGAWTVFDIPVNGFQIENNALYFGDPVRGRIFRYGGVTTDNGLAINSYWRSKTFYAPSILNPTSPPSFEEAFVQKAFTQADFILGESSTTLAYIYTVDSKTATTVNITAYDSAATLIQRNFALAPGKIGKYYDFRIGDNSSAQAWRMMGHRVKYEAQAWRPVTQ